MVLDFSIEIDKVSESEWDNLCLQFRDATINQTWRFGVDVSHERILSHIVLRREGIVRAAVQVRVRTIPVLEAGIAYVGSGPMWKRRGTEDNVDDLRGILKAMRDEYAAHRGLLLRALPNVFDSCPDAETVSSAFRDAGFSRKESAHQTLFLELAPPMDELRRRLDHKWRTNLNNAERTDLQLREGTDSEMFDRFRDAYLAMRRRKAYAPDIDIGNYAAMQGSLPEALKPLIILGELDGRLVAGGVFSVLGDTGTWILGASNDEGVMCNAAYLIQWRAIQRLKERACQYYDLGGADKEKVPGTYRFKSKLCGRNPKVSRRIGEFTACENVVSRMAIISGELLRSCKRIMRGRYASTRGYANHQR
jgi:hypothetical protein